MNPSPKVLIISGVQGDTRRYRTFHLFQQLRLAGISVRLAHITETHLEQTTDAIDILILHRVMWDRFVERIIRRVKARGALLLLDVDDLVFQPDAFQWIDSPDFQDPIRRTLYREHMRRNRMTLDHCDAVLSSTTFLAERVEALGKPVWIHKNGFSLEMYTQAQDALRQLPDKKSDRVVIGYASGTPTHDKDFALIRPVLQRLLVEFPQVELWLMGPLDPGPGWDRLAGHLRRLAFVPWRRLPELLVGLDINLAPLRVDNPFSQSKSEIKYMEAALVGVPTLASSTTAFREAIQEGQNGCLAESPEGWESGLRRLIFDPSFRCAVGSAAREDALRNYAPWVRAGQIVSTLNQIGSQSRQKQSLIQPSNPAPIQDPERHTELWISDSVEQNPTLLARGIYSIRARGLWTLIQEIWIYLRRLVSPVFPFRGSSNK